jgi:hypothetical protein
MNEEIMLYLKKKWSTARFRDRRSDRDVSLKVRDLLTDLSALGRNIPLQRHANQGRKSRACSAGSLVIYSAKRSHGQPSLQNCF